MDLENMNIEKATERCNQLIKPEHANWIGISNQVAIIRVLNELEKKEAVINEMAEYMEEEFAEYQLDYIYAELHNCNGMERNWTRGKEAEIKDIIEYFTNKVEREGK